MYLYFVRCTQMCSNQLQHVFTTIDRYNNKRTVFSLFNTVLNKRFFILPLERNTFMVLHEHILRTSGRCLSRNVRRAVSILTRERVCCAAKARSRKDNAAAIVCSIQLKLQLEYKRAGMVLKLFVFRNQIKSISS